MKTGYGIKKDIINHLDWSADRLLLISNGKDEEVRGNLVRDIKEIISRIQLTDDFSVRSCIGLMDELKIKERLKAYNIILRCT